MFEVYKITSEFSLHAPVVFKKLLRWPVEEENNKYQDFACFYENPVEF
jgi:hypothetical protein